MTKPRKSIHRELYGIIGRVSDASKILKEWNAAFRERGIDASLDLYPTTEENLPERLSEMFHFDRRGYLVGKDLSKAIIPLLDRVEPAARRRGVCFVWNDRGILHGETTKKREPAGACPAGPPSFVLTGWSAEPDSGCGATRTRRPLVA